MCKPTFMNNADIIEDVHKVVKDLLGVANRNALAGPIVQLDIDRPNEHDSKKEFSLEFDTVEKSLQHLRSILDLFAIAEVNREFNAMRDRLRTSLDTHARKSVRQKPAETATDLILKNMADAGFTVSALMAMLDFADCLERRKIELKDQEQEFWSVAHRPPNYYARTIALRLARLYAREMHKKPTSGTARDGGHPSTDFGRAVEQIFAILEISADIRGPSEWAIAQLTEDELLPETKGVLGELFKSHVRSKLKDTTLEDNSIALGSKALSKGTKD